MTTTLLQHGRLAVVSLFFRRGFASKSKEVTAVESTKKAATKKPKPKKVIHKMKSVNLQNKLLFGGLLETQAERVSRVKKETLVLWDQQYDILSPTLASYQVEPQTDEPTTDEKTDKQIGKEIEAEWVKKNKKGTKTKIIKAPTPQPIITLPYPSDQPKEERLPSVTRVLSATMSPEQREILDKWEKKMIKQLGEEGFKAYKQAMFKDGHDLHENIRSALTGTPEDGLSIGERIEGHWNSLKHVVLDMKKVLVLESHVVHPRLNYCGIVDCVGLYRDKLVLIDWKTSEKPKPVVSMTYDTPLQIAAYIGAMKEDPNYKIKIKDGLIVIGYQSGQRGESFFLSQADVAVYWKRWTERLKLYQKTIAKP